MTRQNILITGASSGLGEGMAKIFAAEGRNLVLCARRLDRLEALKSALLDAHPDIRVLIYQLDVNDHSEVFETFHDACQQLGQIDRVIVNAGVGKGAPVGKGHFDENRETAMTNFVAALAQCEAAMEIFRARNAGHLVVISSVSAVRGMKGSMAVYAASKAAVATLAEGIRADMLNKPVVVTTIYPGYIRTPLNENVKNPPFIVDTEKGCRSLVAAIEEEADEAYVPRLPWQPLAATMKHLPLKALSRML
jgi:short-subunit dehydrogenase